MDGRTDIYDYRVALATENLIFIRSLRKTNILHMFLLVLCLLFTRLQNFILKHGTQALCCSMAMITSLDFSQGPIAYFVLQFAAHL